MFSLQNSQAIPVCKLKLACWIGPGTSPRAIELHPFWVKVDSLIPPPLEGLGIDFFCKAITSRRKLSSVLYDRSTKFAGYVRRCKARRARNCAHSASPLPLPTAEHRMGNYFSSRGAPMAPAASFAGGRGGSRAGGGPPDPAAPRTAPTGGLPSPPPVAAAFPLRASRRSASRRAILSSSLSVGGSHSGGWTGTITVAGSMMPSSIGTPPPVLVRVG